MIHIYTSLHCKSISSCNSKILSGTSKFFLKYILHGLKKIKIIDNTHISVFLPIGTCFSAVWPVVCTSPRQQISLSGSGAQTKSPDGVQAKWTGIQKCLWPRVIGTKVIRPSLHTPITPPYSSDFWIRSSRSRASRASFAEFWSTSDTTESAVFPVVDCGTAGWCCRFSNWWHLLWRNLIIGFNIWNSKNTEQLFSWYFYIK